MRADGPVDLLDPYVVLLCEFLGPPTTLQGISNVSDALVSEVQQRDVSGHIRLPPVTRLHMRSS